MINYGHPHPVSCTCTCTSSHSLPVSLLWNFDHRHAWLPLVFLLLFVLSPATAQPQNPAPPPPQDPFARLRFDKTMAAVLVILVLVFFLLGFVSIYTRQCAERRIRGRFDLAVPIIGGSVCRPPRGLDPAIIDTFPNFVYSDVKGIKIGRVTLECAVCLNEFADDETLRLVPKCSHVFHRDCIDVWLVNHSTCPVCRANLAPKPGDVSSSVAIEISEPGDVGSELPEPEANHDLPVNEDHKNRVTTDSPRVNLEDTDRPVRSMSTGFGFARFFPRSYSMGHSLVRPDEDCERFTLRLPEEVQNRLVNSVTLSRTKSWGGTLQSGRRGYRTRSVGRSYLHYERFNEEIRSDRRGFTCTPSFLGRAGSMRSTKDANKAAMVGDEADVEERSSDCLFYKD